MPSMEASRTPLVNNVTCHAYFDIAPPDKGKLFQLTDGGQQSRKPFGQDASASTTSKADPGPAGTATSPSS